MRARLTEPEQPHKLCMLRLTVWARAAITAQPPFAVCTACAAACPAQHTTRKQGKGPEVLEAQELLRTQSSSSSPPISLVGQLLGGLLDAPALLKNLHAARDGGAKGRLTNVVCTHTGVVGRHDMRLLSSRISMLQGKGGGAKGRLNSRLATQQGVHMLLFAPLTHTQV